MAGLGRGAPRERRFQRRNSDCKSCFSASRHFLILCDCEALFVQPLSRSGNLKSGFQYCSLRDIFSPERRGCTFHPVRKHSEDLVSGGIPPFRVLGPAVLAVVMLSLPSNTTAFLAFWSATAVSLLLGFPQNNTNQTLVFFIALSILVSAATSVWRNGLPGLNGSKFHGLPKMFIPWANRQNQRFEAEMSAIRQATDQRTVFGTSTRCDGDSCLRKSNWLSIFPFESRRGRRRHHLQVRIRLIGESHPRAPSSAPTEAPPTGMF